MQTNRKTIVVAGIAVASGVVFVLGWRWTQPALSAGGAIGLAYVLLRSAAVKLRFHFRRKKQPIAAAPAAVGPVVKPVVKPPPEPKDPNDADALVRQMLAQGRYALLLRPQIARDLNPKQLARAMETLEERMALVPHGEVVLGQIDVAFDDGQLEEEEIEACKGRVVRVAHFFLDRYPVTNRQFDDFVAAGGYEQTALWDEKILPAVLDFVDQTGQPGPRFWKNGRYPAGREDHPVVGVSWHEAVAYARWVGKRLPSDAEWVKAGSWTVTLSDNTRVQRRYPWGETMDRNRANVWGSGPNTTVPVNQFADGVSVGGVYHLIGNVWEWTRGELSSGSPLFHDLVFEVPLKSIRGGAFDTYFDNHATCQFQSGETAIARKRNIGFRCALGTCDLMLGRPAQDATVPAEVEEESLEEVSV
jgi:iron(II)-dependent oxidoreductase